MDNPETLAILSTQDIVLRQLSVIGILSTIYQSLTVNNLI